MIPDYVMLTINLLENSEVQDSSINIGDSLPLFASRDDFVHLCKIGPVRSSVIDKGNWNWCGTYLSRVANTYNKPENDFGGSELLVYDALGGKFR